METMTVQQIFEAIDRGMAEVKRQLASGEMDGSGRYWTDEELAQGAATGGAIPPKPARENPAA